MKRFIARLASQAGPELVIASIAVAAILGHLLLRFGMAAAAPWPDVPLWTALVLGGTPLVVELVAKALRREFGADFLAAISIVTAALLEEYLAGTLVVLMLSGGKALEDFAVQRASSALLAMARRMPSIAHQKREHTLQDIPADAIQVRDTLVVFPHEICPVDGVVVEGHGTMDEAYLTGEPFVMSKTPGSQVLSGAINGESSLTIEAVRLPVDSRYAKIMEVMRATEQQRPRLRRLGDRLGAWYTPLALVIAVVAGAAAADPVRFLAVLVVATPCPLLIAIPVSIIGAISLAASRGVVVKNPAVLEQLDTCRTMILDKTGTLTYGRPSLLEEKYYGGLDRDRVLRLAAGLERYSKHPLSAPILEAARDVGLPLESAQEIREAPGQGLQGVVAGHKVEITSRRLLVAREGSEAINILGPETGGLECLVLVDGRLAGHFRFRDAPRGESRSFIAHLSRCHHFDRVMIVSGDRESEVRYLADQVGITEVYSGQTPEQKVEIVRRETARARTIFIGDGINDAPALSAATVGIALGQDSDISAEAAQAVIMDKTLTRVDEFLHISRRMRAVALQSAIGGMALSVLGMAAAAVGLLTPVAGALAQELIDLVAVVNALRAAFPPRSLIDFEP
ncbi:MAG: cadmium-translocating P-type ATPase [Armatimonadetes bacterium]|nr:cadmium-translocating P-type ATPase [Armatimonadota bacterium]